MKRLFVLFLICLLPMQVFAGMVTRTSVPVQSLQLATHTHGVALDVVSGAHHHGGISDPEDADVSAAESEDFSSHAGIGDEPTLSTVPLFALDVTSLAPALRSDAASEPPFLPPAGRPPRI